MERNSIIENLQRKLKIWKKINICKKIKLNKKNLTTLIYNPWPAQSSLPQGNFIYEDIYLKLCYLTWLNII